MSTIPELKKEFTDTLNSLSRSRHPSRVFSDWLEIAACYLHQAPYIIGDFTPDAAHQAIEQKYLETVKNYDREELALMGHMTSITLLAHRTDFCDFLGEVAGESNLLNQHIGQIFTPYSLCSVTAQMTLENALDVLNKNGIITIADPAVGAGALCIACAETLWQQKIDPRSAAQFDAIDVSRNAFNMAYIQLAALDLQAMVRHGNTLTNEMYEHRPTPQLRYFDRELRQLKSINMMRSFFKDPDAFLEGGANNNIQKPTDAIANAPELPTEEKTPDNPIQRSLFASETFTGSNGEKTTGSTKSKPKADIVLPEERQLGLFAVENEAEA